MMTFTTALTIICVMLWIIVFAVMVYNREDRIRFYFTSKKLQMAQLHDLQRQLQEAWDEGDKLSDNLVDSWDYAGNLLVQLHRVARERDNERKLRLEAEDKLLDYRLDKREKDEEGRAADRGLEQSAEELRDTYLEQLENEEE